MNAKKKSSKAKAGKAKLNKKKATLTEGSTITLKVKSANKKVKWSSKNKKIASVAKVSGKKKVINKLIELCRQTGTNVADYPISIVFSNDIKLAEELKGKLIEFFGNEVTILLERLSPSNAAILGNSVIGLSFHVHKKKL